MSSLQAHISPSILNADMSSLAEESQKLVNSGADSIHLDVMDGHFVPNLTFGHPMVSCLRRAIPAATFDVHMMVSEPKKWIKAMADSGANQYTFHYESLESTQEINDCIRLIREAKMIGGLAIKPDTPVGVVFPYVDAKAVDLILIMTVEPGLGGQQFMSQMMTKVKELRQKYPKLNIGVDGGVGPNTIAECANAGANWIVSGSAVIGSQNPRHVMTHMRQVVNEAIERT